MGIILVGHGGLTHPDASYYQEGMDTVAVPPGTSLQYFSEMFQSVYGEHTLPEWLTGWQQLKASPPITPLVAGHATYNFTLAPMFDDDDEANEFLSRADELLKGTGDRIHLADVHGPITLCNGALPKDGGCPTNPKWVANNSSDQRSRHRCEGALGKYTGHLYWVACTTVAGLANQFSEEQSGLGGENSDAQQKWLDEVKTVRDGAVSGSKIHRNHWSNHPDDTIGFTRYFISSLSPLSSEKSQSDASFKQFYNALTADQKRLIWHDADLADWMRSRGLNESDGQPDAVFQAHAQSNDIVTYIRRTLSSDPNQLELVKAYLRKLDPTLANEVCNAPVVSTLLTGWSPQTEKQSDVQRKDLLQMHVDAAVNRWWTSLDAFIRNDQQDESTDDADTDALDSYQSILEDFGQLDPRVQDGAMRNPTLASKWRQAFVLSAVMRCRIIMRDVTDDDRFLTVVRIIASLDNSGQQLAISDEKLNRLKEESMRDHQPQNPDLLEDMEVLHSLENE